MLLDNKTSFIFIGLLGFLMFASTTGVSQKDDTLYFMNGDRISGEIKQYKYGYLTYKTYGVSTVNVKYEKMSTFFSRKNFDILFEDGRRRFGSFDTSSMQQYVKIVTRNDTILTPLIEIVEITPIKSSFWARMSGSVDLGFSYTKATTLSQLSFSSDLKYTQRDYYSSLALNSINSIQKNTEDSRTKKNDATLTIYRRIKNNWFGIGSGSAEQNTQLGLELRLQGGFGIGNELIHTNSNNLMASAGMVVNKEWSSDTTYARINVDGLLLMQYRLFKFSKPEISITSNASAFPSINVANRWRFNYDMKFKLTIISDMYLSFTFYYNYDSKPPSETSEKLDISFTSSFGYSF